MASVYIHIRVAHMYHLALGRFVNICAWREIIPANSLPVILFGLF